MISQLGKVLLVCAGLVSCSCGGRKYAVTKIAPVEIHSATSVSGDHNPAVAALSVSTQNLIVQAVNLEGYSRTFLSNGLAFEQQNRFQDALSNYNAAEEQLKHAQQLSASIPSESRPVKVYLSFIECELDIARVLILLRHSPVEMMQHIDEADAVFKERQDIDNMLIANGWHLRWQETTNLLRYQVGLLKSQAQMRNPENDIPFNSNQTPVAASLVVNRMPVVTPAQVAPARNMVLSPTSPRTSESWIRSCRIGVNSVMVTASNFVPNPWLRFMAMFTASVISETSMAERACRSVRESLDSK